jgi:hypothetical protein
MHHTHPLDLLRRQESKLDLLDRAQWRLGVREVNVRHCERDRSGCVTVFARRMEDHKLVAKEISVINL